MHSYSIDIDNYNTIMGFIIMGSALLILFVNIVILPFFGLTNDNLYSQIFGLFVSPILSFGGIFGLFDNYLWKVSFINKLIKCPNISGKWTGTIKNPEYDPISAEVIIKQTWSKININLRTETADSDTEALAFFVKKYENPRLAYIYYNTSETTDLKSHGGTGKLEYFKSDNVLKGEYYTDKHRTNHGTIYLERK